MESMDHAIAEWNPNAASVFWVRLPPITPGSLVTFHMRVGSENAAVPENPEGVWRNGYAAVLGFDSEGPRYSDATQYDNHGEVNTNGQTEPLVTSGAVGSGIEFAQDTDAVLLPDAEVIRSLRPFTMSAWGWIPPDMNGGRIFGKSQRYLFVKLRSSGSQWEFQSRFQHTSSPPADDGPANDVFNAWVGPTPSPGAWTNVTLRWTGAANSNQLSLYVDGSPATAFNPNRSATGDPVSDAGSPLAVGNSAGFGTGAGFDGGIDHVEISFVNRSADWIQFHVGSVKQSNMSYGPLVRR